MTKEQYDDMMEFAKEEIDSIMDYLEVNYDELSEEDVAMLYRVILEEAPEEEEKEDMHRVLLDAMYELAEEHPKDLLKAMQKVKNYLEK
ncbi:MAG: hypothetical protein ACI4FZ_09860 [Lachnospiraceae bacterium]